MALACRRAALTPPALVVPWTRGRYWKARLGQTSLSFPYLPPRQPPASLSLPAIPARPHRTRAPAGGVRSVDAVRGRTARPDLHIPSTFPLTLSGGGGQVRPNSSHSHSSPVPSSRPRLLARAIPFPFSRLPEAEQPTGGRGSGEEKRVGSFPRSGLLD